MEDTGLEPTALLRVDGTPPYMRRLTDKILHAYAQAYAQGERQLAARLRSLLAEAEAAGRRAYPERRGGSAVQLAEFWSAFCDARELYRLAAEASPAVPPARREATLELMRAAYLRWRRAA
jgi:hypothetical protein